MRKAKFLRAKEFWRGLTACFVVVLVTLLCLTAVAYQYSGMVNSFLNVSTSKLIQLDSDEKVDSTYYPSDYGELSDDNLAKLIADADKHVEQEATEGAVLLKNNGALPLETSERKVTLFGQSSANPLYKPNSGGGMGRDPSRLVTLYSALKEKSFGINETLYNAYLTNMPTVDGRGDGDYDNTNYRRGERPISFYTNSIKNSFSSNTDAAIVVFSRAGGESRDLPVVDNSCTCAGEKHHHLVLHDDEKALLDLINQYNYGKIILLINSAYQMEIEWLDEYNIDAALWIAGPGLTGFRGIANIITGDANPSGKLVDTCAASALSSPAMMNFGHFAFANASEIANEYKDIDSRWTTNYLIQAEGIYVGYKYYETRYEDIILGRGNATSNAGVYKSKTEAWNYADEVTYPFGFGLSYTTFSQNFDSLTVNGDNTFTAKVTVTNTGNIKGKNVVQLYAQVPYTQENRANKLEKSAIQLVGFAKTGILDPNESESVEIEINKYFLASYDHIAEKGYVLDAGNYYFAVGNDVHDALNNILAQKKNDGISIGTLYDHNGDTVTPDPLKTVKKWVLNNKDNTTYRMSQYSQNPMRVTNQFDDMDLNNWISNTVTYLSRNDWKETYPKSYTGITANAAMIKEIGGKWYEKPADAPPTGSFIQGAKNGINFVDMRGVPYEDVLWEKFIDQLTIGEMADIIIDQTGTVAIESVNKPGHRNGDGPDGTSGSYTYGNKGNATAYANQIVATATWNIEILSKRGNLIAEECLYAGVTQIWGPGANLHRTPFSGRNFEYYSEDPMMSYFASAAQTAAMTRKGLSTMIKHFVANDQETNRYGVSTFMNEQTFREVSLKGFEGAFTVGKNRGVMTSFNRLGMTYSGASRALITTVLRGEWNYQGVTITDASGNISYIHTIESTVAGSDMYCMEKGQHRRNELFNAIVQGEGDGNLLLALRKANHNYYYAFVNSSLTNGLTANTRVVTIMPWWQVALVTVNICLGVLALGAAGLFVLNITLWKEKRNSEEPLS